MSELILTGHFFHQKKKFSISKTYDNSCLPYASHANRSRQCVQKFWTKDSDKSFLEKSFGQKQDSQQDSRKHLNKTTNKIAQLRQFQDHQKDWLPPFRKGLSTEFVNPSDLFSYLETVRWTVDGIMMNYGREETSWQAGLSWQADKSKSQQTPDKPFTIPFISDKVSMSPIIGLQ